MSLGYDKTLEVKVVAGGKISLQLVEEDVDEGNKVQLTLAVG